MGIFSRIRRARRAAKAEIKAAKARAVAEVKESKKLQYKTQKMLDSQSKRLAKAEAKGLKAKRKHEKKMAKSTLKQIKAGRLNVSNVTRYLGVLRMVLPLLLPLIYRGIVAAQKSLTDSGSSTRA